ncbi:hypothetical protein [Paenibacillus larvae]|uniref:hypothetical protein n=1 Tax=Paenibacillus larvae TaxID=1464 RepID=UPI0028922EA6|nr:hypothetical protein [Paenibacillus larvae]MDT2193400.1 hypothetical protein [Paenibacillus larvae]
MTSRPKQELTPFNTIANRKEQRIGAESVVVIYPVGSVPFFIGIDEVQPANLLDEF